MSNLAQSFSGLSNSLTNANKRLSVFPGGPLGGAGPLGFNSPRTQARRQLDRTFGVPPAEGDPGYPAPTVPTPVTPLVGNDPTDLNIIAARRQSIEEQLRRRGRMSTVLSNPQTEPLGG